METKIFRKRFSPTDFEKFDEKARNMTKLMYKELYNITLIESPNKYDADLYSPDNGALVECEIRDSWKNTECFPYSDFRITHRKLKYGQFDLVTYNSDMSLALIASVDTIFKHRTNVVLDTNRLSGGKLERFISIPPTELYLIEITYPQQQKDLSNDDI